VAKARPKAKLDGFQEVGKAARKQQLEREQAETDNLESQLRSMGFEVDDRVRQIMKTTKDVNRIVERLFG
jgi:hypothetical protein